MINACLQTTSTCLQMTHMCITLRIISACVRELNKGVIAHVTPCDVSGVWHFTRAWLAPAEHLSRYFFLFKWTASCQEYQMEDRVVYSEFLFTKVALKVTPAGGHKSRPSFLSPLAWFMPVISQCLQSARYKWMYTLSNALYIMVFFSWLRV